MATMTKLYQDHPAVEKFDYDWGDDWGDDTAIKSRDGQRNDRFRESAIDEEIFEQLALPAMGARLL